MARGSWPVAVVLGLLIGLSLACAGLSGTKTKATATPAAATSAATSTPAPAAGNGNGSGADATLTSAPIPAPSATFTPAPVVTSAATSTEALGATATALLTQTGLPGHTGPSDIPVVSGATKILTATDAQVIYQTTTDLATIIKFYMDQMPQNGWTLSSTVTLKEPPTTTMTFTKGKRTAVVSIIAPAGATQLLVSIVITSS